MIPSNDRIPRAELALARQIAERAERNAKFIAATPAQQCVIIAKETIAALDAGYTLAQPGTYLWTCVDGYECIGCALGLSFASMCRLRGLPLESHVGSDNMRFAMSPYFSVSKMKTIEAAFEGWGSGCCKWPERTDATQVFNDGVDDPNERLRHIMRNIIKHKGTFVPEDRPPIESTSAKGSK